MAFQQRQLVVKRSPQTKAELWHWFRAVMGVTIPNVQVCHDHVAPMDVAWAVYTRQFPVIVIKASRGLAGKSQLLAAMAGGLSILQGVEVLVLGGSMHQSLNVQNISGDLWERPMMPKNMLLREPTKTEYVLNNGGRVRAVPASQKSVRGPHPNILLMDEIDEMDLSVLDSAMGMPMPKKGERAVTVMSSTHQYPFGTMTEVLNRAMDRTDWWSVKWCVAQGSPVTTHEGQVPIECLRPDHLVLTRRGWQRLQHLTHMGIKRCTKILLANGDALTATPDHLVATDQGWVPVSQITIGTAVQTVSVAPVRSDVPIAATTFTAGSGSFHGSPSPFHVLGMGATIQVLESHARPVAAQVVDFPPNGKRPSNGLEYDPVDLSGGVTTIWQANVDDPIPVAFGTAPFNADDWHVSHSTSEVVSMETIIEPLPVYDIGVENDHEFIANGVVVHNCWRESSAAPHGWLDPMVVEQKKAELHPVMFKVEVELQDPVIDGTLFPVDKVNDMWDSSRGNYEGKPGELIILEDPQPGVIYATGVDWAKSKDWTVITTRRMDSWDLVAWQRLQRLPWPVMVRAALDRIKAYPGSMAHDATGIGDVIADLFPEEARRYRSIHDVTMRGSARSELFTEYMTAMENGVFHGPEISFPRTEHLYCVYKDLFSVGGHPPDSIVAECMAWYCRGMRLAAGAIKPSVGTQDQSAWNGHSAGLAGLSIGSSGWSGWDR